MVLEQFESNLSLSPEPISVNLPTPLYWAAMYTS